MSLTLVTAPAVEPLTEAEVWDHLRVTLTGSPAVPADQTLISMLIQAARETIDGRDGWLGRSLVTQTWDLTLHDFPRADSIRLPLPPVQSITSVKYIDTDGVEQTFAASKYSLSADTHWRARVDLGFDESWPGTRCVPDAVTVRFVAGYSATSDSPPDLRANVPRPIRQALLLMIGHLYEHREAVSAGVSMSEMPMAVESLLTPYRVTSFR